MSQVFLRIDHMRADRLERTAAKPISNVPSTTIISDSVSPQCILDRGSYPSREYGSTVLRRHIAGNLKRFQILISQR